MKWSYFNQTSAPSVVLIETDQSFRYADAHEWSETLQKINELKPSAIVLPSKPQAWGAVEALDALPIIFGEYVSETRQSVMSKEPYTGLTLLPPNDGSGYRQQWLTYNSSKGTRKSLELVVAEKLTGFKPSAESDRFYIDFRDAHDSIPVIEMSRVQKGELVASLIKDRVILIGYIDALMPKLFTPVGSIQFPLYQAYAIDTLLNENIISHPDLVSIMLLSLVVVICVLLLAPRISDRYQWMSFFAMLSFTLIISWLLMSITNLWIQPGVLIMAELSAFLALYFERNIHRTMQLRKMALNSASNVEHRWLPQNFYTSDEHWTQITNMVSQTLSLNRTIFLERVDDDHRLREIKALNCDLDDINEMRRDYHRKPYTTAIEKGGVLRLDNEYLVYTEELEIQYMVPLNYAGEILGFWALTFKDNDDFDEKKVVHAIERFSSQISELLFHRKQWIKNQNYQKKSWIRFLDVQSGDPTYTSLNHSINFMAQRLTVMESVMDGMETSAILYDLFGRVIQVNESMLNTLSKINLAPYSITAADLISQLSSCDLVAARNYLSYIILDDGTINLPVNHEGIEKEFMLCVRELTNKEQSVTVEGDVQPFEIIGILCELVDMSHISEIYHQKVKVIEHVSGWLKTDLSSIAVACDLANDERVDKEKKAEVLSIIKDKVASLDNNIERINGIMHSDFTAHLSTYSPLDCHKPLLVAIDNVQKNQLKNVEFEIDLPFHFPLVITSPGEIKTIFEVLLKVLYNDVVDNGEIKIVVRNQDNKLEFTFSNKGFGIPDDNLQAYLHNGDVLESGELNALRKIKNQIEDSGGMFSAHSEIGEGMRYTFNLRTFNVHE